MGPPAQPFGNQHFINPTALERNLFLLVEIGCQPIERPTRKRLVEVARISQGGGNDFRHLFWLVRHRPSRTRPILQAVQPRFIEAFEPRADSGLGQFKFLGNRRHALSHIRE